MLNVGLTGGLASGKSVVGRQLEQLGCRVIRMDDLGHEVLKQGGEAYASVVAAFGPAILDPDGVEIPTSGPFGTEFISADTANPNPVGYRSVSTEYSLGAPTITPEVSRIPEPSSALLLVPGLVGLVSLRRRARQSQAA